MPDTTDTDDEQRDRHPWDGHPYQENHPTDAKAIRNQFGLAKWSDLEESFDDRESPYPNCLVHEKPAQKYDHEGGTNFLAIGEKGSGKSTFGLEWATRLMDVNDEAVIWRGSPKRSEWLPLKQYATVCLPAGVDIDARWRTGVRAEGEPAELDEIVRDVIRYDGVIDLLDQLEPHQFYVVYPDPEFRHCNVIMRYSDWCQHEVEYVSQSEASDDERLEPTPTVHWWVAFLVGHLEEGPEDQWTSLIFDEAADLLPENAPADKNQTWEKVQTMRQVMADSRKFRLSVFFYAHHEQNVHSDIRRTIQWRVSMPDGTANPCRENGDTAPVGFSSIKMKKDLLSEQPVGHGIFWTETNFTRFSWDDFPKDPEEPDWLQIKPRLAEQQSIRARVSDRRGPPGGVADD
jgi:hypothetical protein